MNIKTLPYESRGEIRLKAATVSLERYVESALRLLETPTERMVIAHPDLCIWVFRKFKVGIRRYVRRGASRGITVISLGWVILSCRY